MSKSAELKAASDALTAQDAVLTKAVNDALANATINSTPDADVTTAISAVNASAVNSKAASDALNTAFPAPPTP